VALRGQGVKRVVLGQPGLRQVGQQLAQRVRRPHLAVAVGGHQAQPARAAPWGLVSRLCGANERGRQVERVGSRPLQIVEQPTARCPLIRGDW
jgi:hypothetical protein